MWTARRSRRRATSPRRSRKRRRRRRRCPRSSGRSRRSGSAARPGRSRSVGKGKKDKGKKAASAAYVFTTAEAAYRPPTLVKTGIVALDAMVGGGIPRGRFIELFGPYKGGKTALAYEIARAFQQAGGRGRWTDAEHAFDGYTFKRFGGDMKTLDFDDVTDLVEVDVHQAE